MTVKRFVAPDMRRALDLVRQEMGPDAIILSSQRTKQGVEIITSLETDLPTRGADTRREFGRRFDEDVDRPLESDQAWRSHAGVSEAVQRYSEPKTEAPSPRGQALAREIEAARQRMLNAQTQGDAGPAVIETAAASNGVGGLKKTRTAGAADHAPASKARHSAPGVGAVDRQMAGLQDQVRHLEQQRSQKTADNAHLTALQSEIADMRLLLEQQMWQMRSFAEPSAPRNLSLAAETLQNHLKSLGLPAPFIKKLLVCATPDKSINRAWRESLAMLAKQVPVDASDPISKGGIYGFVGPTGVGKTTTIAKLAARYVLQHGLGKVALITTDTYRVGAHDQLRSLGRILNVPVRVVDQERTLPSVVASLKDYPLVLVDTAGFRQGDPLLKEQEAMLDQCLGLERIMVLACNNQLQTIKASAHAYSAGKLRGCILTKLDESASLGDILGVLIQQSLPVTYFSDGQAIPEDIAPASAATLVAKAVALMKQTRRAEKSVSVS